jgi:GH24 family phage-related lysozyme (muramidase)
MILGIKSSKSVAHNPPTEPPSESNAPPARTSMVAGKSLENIRQPCKQVATLHILCTIALTLMIGIITMRYGGAMFIALKELPYTLLAVALYTSTVFVYRFFKKAGTCYLFQATFAGTTGACVYDLAGVEYRLVAMITFIILMNHNICIDLFLYWRGKIERSLLTTRIAMCIALCGVSVGSYVYSLEHFPTHQGAKNTDDEALASTEFPKVTSLLDDKNGVSEFFMGIYQNAREFGKVDKHACRDICGYPCEWVDQLKEFENAPLFKGTEVQSKVHKDKLRPDVKEVGYGVTAGEIYDAKAYGFLPKDAELPKSLTKEEADRWMEEVTLPTYDAMVRARVTVDLTLQQRFALLSFCHNTGGGSLDKLALYKNRLNSGNLACAPGIMRLYVNAGRHMNVSGLVKRRNWEANLFAESLGDVASN